MKTLENLRTNKCKYLFTQERCVRVWKREKQKLKVTQSKWQEEDRSGVTEQSAYFLRRACARSLFKRGINPGYITNPELNQQWSIIENDRYKLGR